MIPFIRSLAELKILTDSRDRNYKNDYNNKYTYCCEDSAQRKRYLRTNKKNIISLPTLPKIEKCRLIKRKEAVYKFFDSLDYNNQIQSSFELTLLARQGKFNQRDVA